MLRDSNKKVSHYEQGQNKADPDRVGKEEIRTPARLRVWVFFLIFYPAQGCFGLEIGQSLTEGCVPRSRVAGHVTRHHC